LAQVTDSTGDVAAHPSRKKEDLMKLWTEEEQARYLKEFAPAAVAVATAAPEPAKPATFMQRADYGVSIGAPIIPLKTKSKIPWHGLGANSRTMDWDLIASWNRQDPTLNCAIVAVHELGGKWFLDDDLGTIEETILKETGHSLAGLYRVRASRGAHYYFEHDEHSLKMEFDGSFNSSVISVPGWKGEARTDNQYVLTAKSIHPSGHIYEVEHCVPIVPAPQWLLDWIKVKYVQSQELNPTKKPKKLRSSVPYGVTRSEDGALIIGKNPPDAGFGKLFEVVGYDPLVRRLNKQVDPRYHNFSLGDGDPNTYCPIPSHCKPEGWDVNLPYTPCFGVIAGAPHLLHCFGCGWSGDMVAACNKVDGGAKTMYQTAREICAEDGLTFEHFFLKVEETTPYMLEQKIEQKAEQLVVNGKLSLIRADMHGGGGAIVPPQFTNYGEEIALHPSAMTSTRLGDIYAEVFEPHGIPLELALPALFTAASVRVPNGIGISDSIVGDDIMCNLYTALIGAVHSGKSQVIEWACKSLNIYKADWAPHYLETKFPSTERMLIYLKKNLSKLGGNFLINPDEWSYLFQKNRVTGSSFPQFMTTSYYRRRQTFPLAGRAGELILNNAISYIGGVVDAEFDSLFDASTLGGLYDRFLFGMKEGWKFDYRPYPGPVELHDNWNAVPVTREGSVFEVIQKWNRENPSRGRIVEIMVRIAVISASIDGRAQITGEDIEKLAPLADNQAAIRGMFSPNVGLTSEARFQHAVLNWLKAHTKDGEWVPIWQVKKGVHAYEMSLGPSVAERTLGSMARSSGLVQVWLPKFKSNGEYETPRPAEWGDKKVPTLGLIRLSQNG
jgi:hypothetical protein